jgi:hypothetical protein
LPIDPALRRLRQEDFELKPAWATIVRSSVKKKKGGGWRGDTAQVIKCSPSKYEVLGSIPSQKEKRKEGLGRCYNMNEP